MAGVLRVASASDYARWARDSADVFTDALAVRGYRVGSVLDLTYRRLAVCSVGVSSPWGGRRLGVVTHSPAPM